MKTVAYIDGQNFLYKAAEILMIKNIISDKQELTAIDIRGLLERAFPGVEMKMRFYGVTKIRREKDFDERTRMKAARFADNLRRMKNSLAKQEIWYVASGVLLARESEPCENCGFHRRHFMEKGVDVSLATDLVNDAATGVVERVILVSSDMDMLPAVMLARKKHKKEVIYVGFAQKLTGAIVKEVDGYKSIKSIEVVRAFLEANQKNS